MFNFARVSLIAVAATIALSSAAHAAAPTRPTSMPCTATFQNTGVEGITDEGKGAYSDLVDGTQCIFRSDGDLMFTLNYNRSKTSRSAIVYLNRPLNNSVDRGVWVVNGMFHLHMTGVILPVGGTMLHRVSFHIPYLGTNYKLHFGWDTGDGTTIGIVSHPTSTTYTITPADPAAISRLWTGGAFGDPTVYDQMGDYYVPFTLTITLK